MAIIKGKEHQIDKELNDLVSVFENFLEEYFELHDIAKDNDSDSYEISSKTISTALNAVGTVYAKLCVEMLTRSGAEARIDDLKKDILRLIDERDSKEGKKL